MSNHFKERAIVRLSFVAIIAAFLCLVITATRPAQGQAQDVTTTTAAPAETVTATPNAQPLDLDRGAAGLWQALLKLHTRASLMMVTAHPDDEDGGMLTYESRGKGARAVLMTLNRGEGGQNAMSDDFWDALGLVRTEELLAADRYYGVQQFWSSVVDFGFSKTAEETMSQWGHDRVLADVVRVVRMTRPLVVTSVFVGGPTDGHGHHAAAGEAAQEVFQAAGDPNMFPDQIREGLRPWSPLKMYARVPFAPASDKGIYDSATGKYFPVRFYDFIQKKWTDGMPSVDLEIPEGNYDPVLGLTYVQISRTGWSLQKSQNGGGAIPFAGPQTTSYHRYASLVPDKGKDQSFFDGVDVSLLGIADLAGSGDNAFLKDSLGRINGFVEQALNQFSVDHPEKIAPFLADGLKETNALVAQVSSSSLSDQAKYDVLHELAIKQGQFQGALLEALGVSIEATAAPAHESGRRGGGGPGGGNNPAESSAYAVPGENFGVRVHLDNPGATPLTIHRIWLTWPTGEDWKVAPAAPVPASIAAGRALDQRFDVRGPDNAAPTRPYFTRPNDEQPYYDLTDERYRNRSTVPYPLSAWVEFSYGGASVEDAQVVQTVRAETGPGTVLEPLMVAPAVSVRIAPQAGITPLGAKSFPITALVHTEAETGSKGTVHLDLPAGWHATPAMASFAMDRAGEDQSVAFQVFPDRLAEKPYTVTAIAESGGRQYREGFISVGYPQLRSENLYMPATYRTSGVDIKVAPGLRVAYVMGSGDDVPQSLENIGVKVEFLSPQDLAQGDLKKYNVIVLGVRTYTARPELATNNRRLLDFVKDGGTVVVQYNSVQYDHNFGPYPYSLPNDAERVVDENSNVTFLDAKDPLLNWPNRITERDFKGWVEERGHSFLKTWDLHYKTPLEMHDPDQDPQKGGLAYATYGKGVYIYVAFALYRQLPDGVPGAYRLFANLLSAPRNPLLYQTTPGATGTKATTTSVADPK